MVSPQRLGMRLAAARERVNLTRAQVADAADCSGSMLLAVEAGEQRPPSTMLVRLAEIIRVDIHDLLCERSMSAELRALCDRNSASLDLSEASPWKRHVARAALAYDLGHLSETELAYCLGADIVTARAMYQGCRMIDFDDVRIVLELVDACAPTR